MYTKPRLDAFNYFCMKDYEWATVIKDQGRTDVEFLEDIASHDFVCVHRGTGGYVSVVAGDLFGGDTDSE